MAPPPLPEEEITELMQWLAEEAKNATSPLNITELCRQFKEETETLVSVSALRKRVDKLRERIHEMDEFDKDTKVKMIFAFSASIDAGFLIELKKVADVKVDQKQRVKKYKAHDGSLALDGDHSNWAKRREKRAGVFNDSIDSEEDEKTAMPRGRKRARLSHSPSEFSEENDDIENPEADGEPSTSPSLSLLEFLNHLRRPAIKLNIPFVANKIDREIEVLEKKEEHIPINNSIVTLKEFILILETPDEMGSDNETISLSDYLYHLGLSMCYIAHPLMNELQKKLRNLVAAEDQKIPLEHIRNATEKALEKINR